jgi:hypothetical protein
VLYAVWYADTVSYVEKGSEVNRPLGVMGRLALCAGLAGAICVAMLAFVVPAKAVVELVDFHVTFGPDQVLITWITGSETDTVGFNLYRAETPDFAGASPLNAQPIPASGDTAGGDYKYEDEGAVPGAAYYWLEVLDLDPNADKVYGPEPSPTPTPISTSTPTSTPTATATSAPTKTPRPTSTSEPTMTPTFTATATPTSTPTATPTATHVSPLASSPTPTSVVEQGLSPTATVESMTQPTLSPAPAATEETPRPTSTTAALASATSTPPSVAWSGGSEPTSSGGSPWRLHLPTVQPSTILLSVSLTSLLGALLLSVALALVHKLSL